MNIPENVATLRRVIRQWRAFSHSAVNVYHGIYAQIFRESVRYVDEYMNEMWPRTFLPIPGVVLGFVWPGKESFYNIAVSL